MKIALLTALLLTAATLGATPAHANAGEWMCVPNQKVPLRVVDGDIECASANGRDCLWDACPGTDTAPRVWTPKVPLRKLACGADHAAKYQGATGYDTEAHWCKQACDGTASCAATWRCLPGVKTPLRLWKGDLQCASRDGRNCLWDVCSGEAAKTTLWTGKDALTPLTCGADHKAKHGTTGYDTPQHWCDVGCKNVAGCAAKR
jgi:hypothetical protein